MESELQIIPDFLLRGRLTPLTLALFKVQLYSINIAIELLLATHS